MAEVYYEPEKFKKIIEKPETFVIRLNRDEARQLYEILDDIHVLTTVSEILRTLL